MEDLYQKITLSFNRALINYLDEKRKISYNGKNYSIKDRIHHLEIQSNVKNKEIKPAQIYLAKSIKLNFTGSLKAIIDWKEGINKKATIDFWANNTRVQYNKDNDEFEIVNIEETFQCLSIY